MGLERCPLQRKREASTVVSCISLPHSLQAIQFSSVRSEKSDSPSEGTGRMWCDALGTRNDRWQNPSYLRVIKIVSSSVPQPFRCYNIAGIHGHATPFFTMANERCCTIFLSVLLFSAAGAMKGFKHNDDLLKPLLSDDTEPGITDLEAGQSSIVEEEADDASPAESMQKQSSGNSTHGERKENEIRRNIHALMLMKPGDPLTEPGWAKRNSGQARRNMVVLSLLKPKDEEQLELHESDKKKKQRTNYESKNKYL